MSKSLLVKVMIIEAVIAFAALAFIGVAWWNRPLGPALQSPSNDPQQRSEAGKLPDAAPDNVTPTPAVTSTPASMLSQIISLMRAPTPTIQTVCGGPPVMTLLLLGSDSRDTGYAYGLADAIRIVRIDFSKPDVMMIDIPRDLWVEIPGVSDHYGLDHGKINQAYFFGGTAMGYYDGPDQGAGLMNQTLQDNFGISADHYLVIDMTTFVRMIDAIGGIDIQVYSTIDLNASQDGGNPIYVFGPGTHHLDGPMAMKLAMNRYPSTFQRGINQDVVMSAIRAKLLTPQMLPKIPGLISQFTNSVQTDLSPSDINKLVCLGEMLTSENINLLEFPQDMFNGTMIYDPYRKVETYIMEADNSLMRSYLADFMAGTWPKN